MDDVEWAGKEVLVQYKDALSNRVVVLQLCRILQSSRAILKILMARLCPDRQESEFLWV